MAGLLKSLKKVTGGNDTLQGIDLWLDTGLPALNRAISGSYQGGIPGSRITEIFGPSSSGKTLIATKAMISAQQAGGIACFMDHERSFESKLAERMGLSLDEDLNWVYKAPDTFEQSIDLMKEIVNTVRGEELIDPKAPIVFVFDSLASMIPQSRFDKAAGENNMNDNTALARATSAHFPAIAQICYRHNVTAIFLNQARTKIGVMYGDPTCVHGRTKVPFVDGTFATMKEVVEQQIDKEVWSLNEETGELEPRKIIGWHDNGEIEDVGDWVYIKTKALHTRNGINAITVTHDHKVLTQNGWVSASQVSVGDQMMTRRITKLNGTYEQFLRAAMSGDAHVLRNGNRTGQCLRIQDNNDPEYMRWKKDKLSVGLNFTKSSMRLNGKEYELWTASADTDVALIDAELRGKRCPLQMLGDFSPLALAVWIMDDGYLDSTRDRYSLSVKRFSRSEDLTRIADRLFDLGFDFGVRRGEGRFDFTQESSDKIADMIAQYVPPCMEHKLPEKYRGRYVDFDLSFEEKTVPEMVDVLEVRGLGEKARMWRRTRYDITVEGNHNYMIGNRVNGVIVHNCTPGGNAPEYYASVRIKLGRSQLKDGKEKIGQAIGCEVIKNKVSSPFRRCDWNFYYDSGLDVIESTIDHMIERDIFKSPSKGFYEFAGKKLRKAQLVDFFKKAGIEKLSRLLPVERIEFNEDKGIYEGVVESEIDPSDENCVEVLS